MLDLRYKKINTPFICPFETAHGRKTHQPALLVALQYKGCTGYGEAPAIHYYNVTVEEMEEQLLRKTAMLVRYAFTEPERFWHFCHHLFPHHPFLVCALDMAYWDLYAKLHGKHPYQLWQLEWKQVPLTDYTIGWDTTEAMLQKMEQFPWPVYKIKVRDAADLETLRVLRAHTDARFRVDANEAWQTAEALALIPDLQALGVELIEQPLHRNNVEGMKQLRALSPIPLFADESCVTESDVAVCASSFHGINIKLTKCGGLTPALRMIKEARTLGLKVMMGCMNETETGSYAIAQFLPLLDEVDMDGPLLLDVPPLTRLRYEAGQVSLC